MLKKLSILLLLGALCVWAADFWSTKPFTEWSDKEVQKVLTDSPWTGKLNVTFSAGGGGNGAPVPVAGAGGGGRGGDAGGGPPAGGFGGGESTVTLVWQSALPVKQAIVKRRFAAEAGKSAEAKALLDREEKFYVLTLTGVPGNMLGETRGDQKAVLLDNTTVTAGGKPPLKATDVQTSMGKGGGTVSFLFPKTTTFTADDKDLEFSSKFGTKVLKHKFKLKDMVVNGKVEM